MTGTGSRWRRALAASALAVALTTGACRPADQETGSLDPQGAATRTQLPEELVAALDSGSQAFRAGAMDEALAQYERATELAPDHAAGWFGIYMVHQRRGDAEAAAAALERAQAAAPGATIIHPTDADTVP